MRVYEPLEKNVGWWAKDKYEAQTAALIKNVGFVRYTNEKDGKTYDLRYVGGNSSMDSSFEKTIFDESKDLIYKWKCINENLSGEIRLGRHGYEILNFNNKILVRYYMFGYSEFDMNHTLLGALSRVGCFDEVSYTIDEPSRWCKEIDTAFKD